MRRALCVVAVALALELSLDSLATGPAFAGGVLGPSKPAQLIALTSRAGADACPGQSGWDAVDFLPLHGETFDVPAKQVLIVTELTLVRFGGAPSSNEACAWLVTGPDNIVARQSTALDSVGAGGSTMTIPQGFAVRHGETLCVEHATFGSRNVWAYGYLAPVARDEAIPTPVPTP